MERDMCPHCGYNFAADAPLVIGGWRVTPEHAEYDGKSLWLTRSEAAVLYSIARAKGEWISADAILNRMSSSENTNNIAVLLHRVRKKAAFVPLPIISRRGPHSGGGYRWAEAR